jgi:ECF sigma factor
VNQYYFYVHDRDWGHQVNRKFPAAQGERTLVGAWQTRVRPGNCETGEVAPIAGLRGLFTFHEGGTASEFGVPPGMSPRCAVPDTVCGAANPAGTSTRAFTYYRYDASGAYAGQQTVTSVQELDVTGDAFISNSTVEGFDANDNLVLTACAQAVGSRFQ